MYVPQMTNPSPGVLLMYTQGRCVVLENKAFGTYPHMSSQESLYLTSTAAKWGYVRFIYISFFINKWSFIYFELLILFTRILFSIFHSQSLTAQNRMLWFSGVHDNIQITVHPNGLSTDLSDSVHRCLHDLPVVNNHLALDVGPLL